MFILIFLFMSCAAEPLLTFLIEIHELRRWFDVHRLPLASAKRRTLRPLSLRPSQYAPSYVQIEHFDDLLFGMEKTGRNFSTISSLIPEKK